MCRLTAYFGSPIYIADLVTRPERSVIRQSFDARERLGGSGINVYEIGALNADGFGLGWYPSVKTCPDTVDEAQDDSNLTPCVFTDVGPAWNNANLIRLARKIESSIIFAHVRAAGPGMGVSVESSHPFEFGRYLFMHNGQVAGFDRIRRYLLSSLSDVAHTFAIAHSCSDTAVAFAVFIDLLGDSMTMISPAQLQNVLNQMIEKLCAACETHGIEGPSLLNFVVSDGNSLCASRCVYGKGKAASLYYASGSSFEPEQDCSPQDVQRYRMVRRDKNDQVVIITSEPLTSARADWVPIPSNHFVLVTPEKRVLLTPIVLVNNECCAGRKMRSELAGRMMERLGLNNSNLQQHRSTSFLYDKISSGHGDNCTSPAAAPLSPVMPEMQCGEAALPTHTLMGRHSSAIMAITMFGKYLFSAEAGNAGTICIWDTLVWKCVGNHKVGGLLAMTMDSERKVLYTSCSNNVVYAWRVEVMEKGVSLNLLFEIRLPSVGHVLSIGVCVKENHLYIGSQDACLRQIVLPSISGAEFRIRKPAMDVQVQGSESYFELYVCEQVSSGDTLNDISDIGGVTTHCSFIYQVLVLEKYVVTGAGDGIVKVWNKIDRSLKCSLFGHRDSVLSLCAHVDSNMLFSGSADGAIRLWDLDSMGCRREIRCGSDVNSLAISTGPRSSFLFSALSDQTICVWKLHSYERVNVFRVPLGVVFCVDVFHNINKSTIVCGTSAGSILSWIWSSSMQRRPSSTVFVNGEFVDLNLITDENVRDQTLIDVLESFVALQSVSANPKKSEDCWLAARFISDFLENCGATVKMCLSNNDDMNGSSKSVHSLPVVLGKFYGSNSSPERKNVIIYSHYDVVHAVKENWSTDPWILTGIDGYLYGRGSTDAKGPLLACVLATQALYAAGNLHIDVTFVIEGQEESGINTKFRGFEEVIHANMNWFEDAYAIFISNNYWIDDTRPCLTYGMRGVIDFQVQINGQESDLHAGIHGGSLHESTRDLLSILASLTDVNGGIAVPELLANVKPLSQEEREKYLKVNLSIEEYSAQVGISELRFNDVVEVLKSRWSEPALSIGSLVTSNTAQAFRRIPCVAAARVSCHFVPDQNSQDLCTAIEDYLQSSFARLKSSNSMSISFSQVSEWWLADTNCSVFRVAEDAMRAVWGVDPLYVREGGSYGGITAFLERTLNAPAIHLPMGQATNRAHLANERICVENLFQGRRVVQSFLERIADTSRQ